MMRRVFGAVQSSSSLAARERMETRELVVRAALLEYSYLRQESMQYTQHMAAAAALGLAIAGYVVAQFLGQNLKDMEPTVLLIAAWLILMIVVAVVAMALRISAMHRWLQHIGEAHVRKTVEEGVGPAAVPQDLMGWDDFLVDPRGKAITGIGLRRLVWLELAPLPVAAVLFQIQAWSDMASRPNPQWLTADVLILLLLAVDVCAALFIRVALKKVEALRHCRIPSDILRAG